MPDWICCCVYDPPGLRCRPCNYGMHDNCIDKLTVRDPQESSDDR